MIREKLTRAVETRLAAKEPQMKEEARKVEENRKKGKGEVGSASAVAATSNSSSSSGGTGAGASSSSSSSSSGSGESSYLSSSSSSSSSSNQNLVKSIDPLVFDKLIKDLTDNTARALDKLTKDLPADTACALKEICTRTAEALNHAADVISSNKEAVEAFMKCKNLIDSLSARIALAARYYDSTKTKVADDDAIDEATTDVAAACDRAKAAARDVYIKRHIELTLAAHFAKEGCSTIAKASTAADEADRVRTYAAGRTLAAENAKANFIAIALATVKAILTKQADAKDLINKTVRADTFLSNTRSSSEFAAQTLENNAGILDDLTRDADAEAEADADSIVRGDDPVAARTKADTSLTLAFENDLKAALTEAGGTYKAALAAADAAYADARARAVEDLAHAAALNATAAASAAKVAESAQVAISAAGKCISTFSTTSDAAAARATIAKISQEFSNNLKTA